MKFFNIILLITIALQITQQKNLLEEVSDHIQMISTLLQKH